MGRSSELPVQSEIQEGESVSVSLKLVDNTVKILREFESAKEQILFEMGAYFTEKWDDQIVEKHVIDTGRFRNSIDHAEDEKSTYIGTPIGKEGSKEDQPYPIYLELGTSKMAARPTLRPAITENTDGARNLAEDILKGQ